MWILYFQIKIVLLHCQSAGNDYKTHCQHYKKEQKRSGILLSDLVF